MDEHLKRTIDAVGKVTFFDGMIYGGHRLGKRGLFYETNASVLNFYIDYVRRTGDISQINLARKWLDYMIKNTTDEKNKPFLFRTPYSTGISGEFKGGYVSNWWDVIQFGGYDAYINSLYYNALKEMAKIEQRAENRFLSARNKAFAEKVKESFNKYLWNPKTKRYAGWLDLEGNLHDYWFTFINLMAVWYGIIEGQQAKSLLQRLDTKLKKIGYKGFSLPGNLESIPSEDYSGGDWWLEEYGYRHFYDEFGTYLNGGVWPWVSGFYIADWGKINPDKALQHYVDLLKQYSKDNLYGAGNGYFWDTETGEVYLGSREEQYLANTTVAIWGFYTLFGIRMDILNGLSIEPNLPKALDGTKIRFMYRGNMLSIEYIGCGSKIYRIEVDDKVVRDSFRIPDEYLMPYSHIKIYMADKSKRGKRA